jgi:hypothetical protein
MDKRTKEAIPRSIAERMRLLNITAKQSRAAKEQTIISPR